MTLDEIKNLDNESLGSEMTLDRVEHYLDMMAHDCWKWSVFTCSEEQQLRLEAIAEYYEDAIDFLDEIRQMPEQETK